MVAVVFVVPGMVVVVFLCGVVLYQAGFLVDAALRHSGSWKGTISLNFN